MGIVSPLSKKLSDAAKKAGKAEAAKNKKGTAASRAAAKVKKRVQASTAKKATAKKRATKPTKKKTLRVSNRRVARTKQLVVRKNTTPAKTASTAKATPKAAKAAPKDTSIKARRARAARAGTKAGKATRSALGKVKKVVAKHKGSLKQSVRKLTQPARVLAKKGLASKGGRMAAGRLGLYGAVGVAGYEAGKLAGLDKKGAEAGGKLGQAKVREARRKLKEQDLAKMRERNAKRKAELKAGKAGKPATTASSATKSRATGGAKGFGIKLAGTAAELRAQRKTRAATKAAADKKKPVKTRLQTAIDNSPKNDKRKRK